MNPELLIPLELLGPGEFADVAELHGAPGWVARMAELGLQPGNRIRMIRSGCPCLLLIGNCRLCLRGDDCMQVMVRPVPSLASQSVSA